MRKLLLLICLVTFEPALSASPPAQPRQALLGILKAQLTAIRASKRSANPAITRPDPSALIGVRRSEISAALGSPDFCRNSPSNQCADASKWDFFYFKHPPGFVDHGDTVTLELTVGGWALVLDFNGVNEVSEASWVPQE